MATIASSAAMAQQMQYPKAAKDGTVDEYFGTKVADPYRWLENDTSAQTAAWVEAENQVTNAFLKKIPFREKLLKRLTQLSNYDTSGAPFKRHGRWYVSKHTGLQNQSVIYQMDRLGGEERVFLDPNTLSTDGTVALKSLTFSNNGRWAAYSISRSGSDWQEFFVIDLQTGQLTQDHIEWAKFSSASWLGDGFYYSAPKRARSSRTSTRCRKYTTTRWARPRARMCCSTRIPPSRSVSTTSASTRRRPSCIFTRAEREPATTSLCATCANPTRSSSR